MPRKLSTALAICLALIGTTFAKAQATDVQKENTNPGDGFGFIGKRIGEKFKLFIYSPFPKAKENLYEDLVKRRLAELKYVIEKPDMANFEKATIRYSTTVGTWAEYIQKKKLNDQKQSAVETLSSHLGVVEKLMTKYDPTTAEWRFVKHDFDFLNIYISKLAQ